MPKLGVIHWEFSALDAVSTGSATRTSLSLLVYLEAVPAWEPRHSAVLALVQDINGSYHTCILVNGSASWTPDSAPSDPLPPTSPVPRIFRSAVIIHGRDIINNAIENDWSGFCADPGNEKKRWASPAFVSNWSTASTIRREQHGRICRN